MGKKLRGVEIIFEICFSSVVQYEISQPARQQHPEEVPGARGLVLCGRAEAKMDGGEDGRERWQRAPDWRSPGLSESVRAARGGEGRPRRYKKKEALLPQCH